MATLSGRGKPKPYILQGVKIDEGQYVQHAIMKCCECVNQTMIKWPFPENPMSIAQRFIKLGWEVNTSNARCPEHAKTNKQRKAAFARLDQKEKDMQTPRKIPHEFNANEPAHVMTTYLMTVNDRAEVEITPVENVQEMLLGDKTYMVIPR